MILRKRKVRFATAIRQREPSRRTDCGDVYKRQGFLGAADDVLHQIRALGKQDGDKVGAIVHGDLWFMVQSGVDVRVIGGVVFALNGEGRDLSLIHI